MRRQRAPQLEDWLSVLSPPAKLEDLAGVPVLQSQHLVQFGSLHVKFMASFVSPFPLYLTT